MSTEVDDQEPNQIQLANGRNEECRTPTSQHHRIPKTRTCPPAPRKQGHRVFSPKRKMPELNFFENTRREEIESFFQSPFDFSVVVVSKSRS
ncbi:hypothetical protein RHGRI_036617 [Rhododendron griersonianum]|uniref:Cyclin-dependent protein kinase inhibitor SMR2 n=1 Tax=Rhododendron griersonianum TaxID=479676 RepID=A0AAV6HS59_9ERIC|nr:hypothetical protein RHGRI_036617 [Rhododendron griersonianum]